MTARRAFSPALTARYSRNAPPTREMAGMTPSGTCPRTPIARAMIGPSASSGPAATAEPRSQPPRNVSLTTRVRTGPGLMPAMKPMPAPSSRNVRTVDTAFILPAALILPSLYSLYEAQRRADPDHAHWQLAAATAFDRPGLRKRSRPGRPGGARHTGH